MVGIGDNGGLSGGPEHRTRARRNRPSTDARHLDPTKINGLERGIAYLLGKVRAIGPHTHAWAEAVVAARGIESYFHFYHVYGLLNGPDAAGLLAGRRVVVMTSNINDRRNALLRAVMYRGAAHATFYETSRNKPALAPRLLGEWMGSSEQRPSLVFRLGSLGPALTAEIKAVEKGKETVRTVGYREGKGTLEVAGKKLPVVPRITTEYTTNKEAAINGVRMNAYVTVRAGDLGLAAVPADDLIDIRLGMSGTTLTQPPPKK